MKDRLSKLYLYLVFIFLYAPIIILMIYSFNESKYRVWTGFSLKWYIELFHNRQIMDALYNTIFVAVIASILSTIIGTAAAIGIDGLKKWQKSTVMNVTMLPVLNPDIVTGISLMLLFYIGKLPTGRFTLILAHMSFCIPYVILSVMPKLKQVNAGTYEAALDLGATPALATVKVTLPEIMPGVINGLLMAFTLSIDDFIVSYFTTGPGVENLSILIYNAAKKGVSPSINALSALMFAVILVLLIIINARTNKNAAKA
ncbi:ABC transporter permease subunit [Congzhengia sp.]|jgi:spermidine/putrescine transport system permease protein|uniref:ABC transporter permease subunit n=1 Tax=Congzhengia sp. TaxID=2944168 RepID=UPI000E905F56|nr:ABC transporter permease [Clostridiales bacterium]HBL81248.1 spermidine/putrescine ABC transporter permease [Clostridiales bacterium]